MPPRKKRSDPIDDQPVVISPEEIECMRRLLDRVRSSILSHRLYHRIDIATSNIGLSETLEMFYESDILLMGDIHGLFNRILEYSREFFRNSTRSRESSDRPQESSSGDPQASTSRDLPEGHVEHYTTSWFVTFVSLPKANPRSNTNIIQPTAGSSSKRRRISSSGRTRASSNRDLPQHSPERSASTWQMSPDRSLQRANSGSSRSTEQRGSSRATREPTEGSARGTSRSPGNSDSRQRRRRRRSVVGSEQSSDRKRASSSRGPAGANLRATNAWNVTWILSSDDSSSASDETAERPTEGSTHGASHSCSNEKRTVTPEHRNTIRQQLNLLFTALQFRYMGLGRSNQNRWQDMLFAYNSNIDCLEEVRRLFHSILQPDRESAQSGIGSGVSPSSQRASSGHAQPPSSRDIPTEHFIRASIHLPPRPQQRTGPGFPTNIMQPTGMFSPSGIGSRVSSNRQLSSSGHPQASPSRDLLEHSSERPENTSQLWPDRPEQRAGPGSSRSTEEPGATDETTEGSTEGTSESSEDSDIGQRHKRSRNI